MILIKNIVDISLLSGYEDGIEVIDLAPKLDSNINKTLSRRMNLSNGLYTQFIDNLGFNFKTILRWIGLNSSMSLDEFINNQIENKEIKIMEFLNENSALFETLMNKSLEDLKKFLNKTDLEFLQERNILIINRQRKLGWHNLIVKKAFENLRMKENKKKFDLEDNLRG